MRERVIGSWDRGYEVKEVYKLLVEELKKNIKLYNKPKLFSERMPESLAKAKIRARIVHLSVLLIQLRNACRVSEACEGLFKWLEFGKTKVYVRVRKRKDNEQRAIVIPKEVLNVKNIVKLYSIENVDRLAKRVKSWTVIYFSKDLNTHSLRYAKITELLDKGYNPILVAKITKHKKIDMLVEYAQEKKAEEILEKEEW